MNVLLEYFNAHINLFNSYICIFHRTLNKGRDLWEYKSDLTQQKQSRNGSLNVTLNNTKHVCQNISIIVHAYDYKLTVSIQIT